MFGPRLTTVFASRWKAAWWAVVVLATAYCSIPSAEQTEQAEQAAQPHKSPWAREAGDSAQ